VSLRAHSALTCAARSLAGPCLILLLAACTRNDAADFGRRPNTTVTGSILPGAGVVSSWWRGEPTSLYPFTDDEIEMRDRAWRFLMPSHDKANLQQAIAELAYTRILPPIPHSGRNHYHLLLMAEDYRSVASRYAKLGQDVEADRLLLLPFSQAAAKVCAADRVRALALNDVKELSHRQREQGVARIAENRMLVDWVRRDMRDKAAAYRYALEHVSIEAPMREAIRSEQALVALESAQQTLDYWDGCGENPLPLPPHMSRRGPVTDKDTARTPYSPASPPPVNDRQGVISARPPK
jgi:hypothetical protein